jgi:hypothetical protein
MALSIDGFCGGVNTTAGSNPSNTGALTLAQTGDIIVVCILAESTSAGSTPSVSSISDGTANVYAKRNAVTYQSNATFGTAKTDAEIWWAFSSAAHTIAIGSLVVTMSNLNDDAMFIAFGVTGFTGGVGYQTNPWDQSAATALGFALTNNAGTVSQLVSGANISTVNAAALIFAFGGSSDNSGTVHFNDNYAPGPYGGTTATDSGAGAVRTTSNTNAALGGVEYRIVSATQSSISAAFAVAATAGGWAIMPDALSQTGGAVAGVMAVLIAHG